MRPTRDASSNVWLRARGDDGRASVALPPHPRDREWRERFAPALAAPDVAVQEPSYTDLETLATLLQHGERVVANAGTIFWTSVNDRPAVCAIYDEGASPGESWALKNVVGEHYRELIESGAFLRADRFEDVVSGIQRCLEAPDELAEERRRVVQAVVGDVDGRVPNVSSRRSQTRSHSPFCHGGSRRRARHPEGAGGSSGPGRSVGIPVKTQLRLAQVGSNEKRRRTEFGRVLTSQVSRPRLVAHLGSRESSCNSPTTSRRAEQIRS